MWNSTRNQVGAWLLFRAHCFLPNLSKIPALIQGKSVARGIASATVQPSRFAASQVDVGHAATLPRCRLRSPLLAAVPGVGGVPRAFVCVDLTGLGVVAVGRDGKMGRKGGLRSAHGPRPSVGARSTQTHPCLPKGPRHAQAKRPGRKAASASSDRMASVCTHLGDIRVGVQVIDNPKDYPGPGKIWGKTQFRHQAPKGKKAQHSRPKSDSATHSP